MNARVMAQMTLDELPFAADREQIVEAVTEGLERAYEHGRVDGRLEVLQEVTGH